MSARLTGTARYDLAADLAARYRAGDTIRGLAAHIDRPYGITRSLLLEAGVTLRPRGGNHRLSRAERVAR